MRLDEVGRGKGDEESGSKAGSNEGFGAISSRCSSGSRGSCRALACGKESMLAADGIREQKRAPGRRVEPQSGQRKGEVAGRRQPVDETAAAEQRKRVKAENREVKKKGHGLKWSGRRGHKVN